jgi:hypothetical protein
MRIDVSPGFDQARMRRTNHPLHLRQRASKRRPPESSLARPQ